MKNDEKTSRAATHAGNDDRHRAPRFQVDADDVVHLPTARPSGEGPAPGSGPSRRGALDVLDSDVILYERGGRLHRRADEGALRELQLNVELVVSSSW
jgi:hypothetical protein